MDSIVKAQSPSLVFLRAFLWSISCFSILLGKVVLFGWFFGNSFLIQIIPSFAPMMPLTAICFVLFGYSLGLSLLKYFKSAAIIAGIIITLAALTLSQYLLYWLLKYDTSNLNTSFSQLQFPGTPGPNTAICILLLGISLFLTTFPYRQIFSFVCIILSCIAISIASIPLIGYLFQFYKVLSWYGFTGMALHTSIGIILLGIAIYLLHTVYLFNKQKFLYGSMIGATFFLLYITFFLWVEYRQSQYDAFLRIAQNNTNFLAYNLNNNIDNLTLSSLQRLVLRWNILHGYTKDLWDNDTEAYVQHLPYINRISLYDETGQRRWTTRNKYLDSVEKSNANIEDRFSYLNANILEGAIAHFYERENLYILFPISKNAQTSLEFLVAEIDLRKFISHSVPKFLINCYEIEIFDKGKLVFKSNELKQLGPTTSAEVNSNFLDWKVNLTSLQSPFSSHLIPNTVLLLGLLLSILVSALLYLLQLVLLSKEKVLDNFRQQSIDTAFKQALLNSSNYSIIATNPEGIIISFNKAAEKMLLWKSEEMVNKQSPSIFHDKKEMEIRGKELSEKLHKKIEGFDVFVALPSMLNKAEESEWTYIRKDGSTFPVKLSVTAVKSPSGELLGFVGIAYDLTEIKKIEDTKNGLISITSHELRAPLATIKGSLDLVNNSQVSENDLVLINIARSNAERLLRITNDILDLQKMELGKIEYHFKLFNLKDLFQKVAESNETYAQKRKVTLKYPTPLPEELIYGDEERILQVLTNFISNAVKNSPTDGEVSFEVAKKGSFIRIGVIDHGAGIPEEFQKQIFQKFAQSGSHKKEGTGLGLNISKMIIEKHGGRVGFDTGPTGSTFWFEIPMKQNQ